MHTRRTHRTYVCSFCGKNQDQVQRLVAGPDGVCICNECIDLISRGNAEQQKETNSTRKTGGASNRCSFCGKKQEHVLYFHTSPEGVNICSECIDLCREIIDEETSRH